MDGTVDFFLKMAGVPDNVVADLDKSAPALAQLVALAKQLEPIFNKSQPLAAHIAQAAPLVKAAVPAITSVLPTVEELVAFATAKAK